MSTHSELMERAAEDAGAVDAGLGLNPLVGFGAADLIAAFRQIAQHVLQRPWVDAGIPVDLAGSCCGR